MQRHRHGGAAHFIEVVGLAEIVVRVRVSSRSLRRSPTSRWAAHLSARDAGEIAAVAFDSATRTPTKPNVNQIVTETKSRDTTGAGRLNRRASKYRRILSQRRRSNPSKIRKRLRAAGVTSRAFTQIHYARRSGMAVALPREDAKTAFATIARTSRDGRRLPAGGKL